MSDNAALIPLIMQRGSEYFDQLADQNKQRARNFKALQEYADVNGIADKTQTTPMGLDQLQGMVEGTIAKRKYAQAQQEQAYRDALTQHVLRQSAEQQADAAKMDALNQLVAQQTAPDTSQTRPNLGPYYENPEQFPNGPPAPEPTPMNYQALLRAAAQTGTMGMRGIDSLMTHAGANEERIAAAALRAKELGDTAPSFSEDPVSGNRFAIFNRTMAGSGVNPSKISSGAIPQVDETTGETIGYSVPIGGGKYAYRPAKPPVSGNLASVIDPSTGKPAKGFGLDAAGKIHDLRPRDATGQIAAALGTDESPAEASPDSYEAQLQQLGLTPDQVTEATALADQAGKGKAGLTSAAGAPLRRVTTLQPPVGTVKAYQGKRYKFNGKFQVNDKRAWDEVP